MKDMSIDLESLVLGALENYLKDRGPDAPTGVKGFDPDYFLYDFGTWLAAKHKEMTK